MRYKDELYCKLDLVKQAVVDIEEYIDIIDEVQIYLENSKTEFMKKPKYEPLKMIDKKFADEYGKKLMQWDKYKEEERKLKQMWDEGETFR